MGITNSKLLADLSLSDQQKKHRTPGAYSWDPFLLPIIMIDQSKMGSSSGIIFITLFSSWCRGLLRYLPASPNSANIHEKNHFLEPNWRMLTSLCLIFMCRVTYQAPFTSLAKLTKYTGEKQFSWAKLAYVDFSSSGVNVQGHIPSTGGDPLMGAKYDKVKKERAKGRLRGKNCSSTLVLTTITTMAMGEPAPMLVTW